MLLECGWLRHVASSSRFALNNLVTRIGNGVGSSLRSLSYSVLYLVFSCAYFTYLIYILLFTTDSIYSDASLGCLYVSMIALVSLD